MIKLLEPHDTNTDISWWNANRRRLNDVIYAFNAWQTQHRFDQWEKEKLQAQITLCRQFGQDNHFSDWQFETLDEMEAFIEEHDAQTE